VSAIVRREVEAMGLEARGDVLGSTVARVRGTEEGRLLALVAHVDEIGLLVRSVRSDGLLRVARLGDWSAATAMFQRVEIVTERGTVPGVVAGGGRRRVSWDDLLVDIGAADREQALELVSPGDGAVVVGAPIGLHGDRITSVSLDDRAGVYSAIEALRRLAAEPPAWDVALVASTQEEAVSRGSAAAVMDMLRPEISLVVETTYASDVPAGREPWGDAPLGAGPVVFRGPVVHPGVAGGLLETARAEGLPVSIETGPDTWTDADAIFVRAGGIAVGLVGIPIRYAHTPVEVADLIDIETTVRLLEAYVRGLDPELDLSR
jgi:endoglucanase